MVGYRCEGLNWWDLGMQSVDITETRDEKHMPTVKKIRRLQDAVMKKFQKYSEGKCKKLYNVSYHYLIHL